MRDVLFFGFLLVLAAALVVTGVTMWFGAGAGFIVAGVLVALEAWLFFGDMAE